MSVKGVGFELDVSFDTTAQLLTSTSQYKVVSMVPGTVTGSRAVDWAGCTTTAGTPTATAFHAIGICQESLKSSSEQCTVRLWGISKATCAESITAGEWVMAYWGVSTTTRKGHIVAVDDGVTMTAYGASVSAHVTILGRALQKGSTDSVISIFLNPSLYDFQFVGTIGIT